LITWLSPDQGTDDDGGQEDEQVYHADFTYPFFGEEELIYGMRGLSVQFSFTAASLRPLIELKYRNALPAIQPLKAAVEPILDRMYPWMENPLKRDGSLWTSRREQFAQWQQEDRTLWKPVGEKVHQ
jgi:histone acetyltransferase 1